MTTSMLTIERKKLMKQNIFWIALSALAMIIILIYGVIFAVQYLPVPDMPPEAKAQLVSFLTWPEALINALGFASGNGLGGLLTILLASIIVTQEYTHKTYQLWLGKGISRIKVITSKFIVLLMAVFWVVLIPVVIGGLISAGINLLLYGTIPFSSVNFVQLGLSLLRTILTLLPYITMAIFLAVISRSTIITLGLGLAYALLIEGVFSQLISLIGGLPAKIIQFSPNMLAASITQLNTAIARGPLPTKPELELALVDPATASICILGYSVLFLSLAVIIFRRQDIAF